MQQEKEAVIQTQDLTKKFGKRTAVNGVNVQVFRGDVFGFLGPNGSGKTTTIRLLLGLLRPTSGRIELFGTPTTHHLPTLLQRIGAIIETPAFYSYLTGKENLHTIAMASGVTPDAKLKERISTVLDMVGLQSYPRLAFRKYSLGMKQRLAIAATLLTDPELIMLDEPTNGLDPEGVIEVRQLIASLADRGKTVFLSSHMLTEVQQVCTRVAIMRQGKIVVQGSVSDLLHDNEQIEVRMMHPEQTQLAYDFLQQAREQGMAWLHKVELQTDKHNNPLLIINAPARHAADINVLLVEQKILIAEIHPREGNLEDLFLRTTSTQ